MRKQEAEAAAKIQGAHLHLKNLDDTNISEGVETISVIESLVQAINPTYVYSHSIHDTHKDHRSVHLATLSACRHIPNLYCYQSPSSSVDFKPNLFIDISGEHLENKLKAIACYTSQCELRPYLNESLLYSTARYWGRYCNYGLAEPMEVIRQKS
jgi:LmbE family N-acetylglucosaminyl deacetylase